MLWEDLLIDRSVTDGEIESALVELFSILPSDIMIVESIEELHRVVEVKVLCERQAVKGDFPLRLSIYVRYPGLEQLESLPLIEEFCEKLHCSCLISDESINPYSMLLVRGGGDTRAVYLDPERLDDHEEYVIKDLNTGTELQ